MVDRSKVQDLLSDILLAIEDKADLGFEGRAVTDRLYVSPNGDGSDGSTWENAYKTIQDALDNASVDASDLTLISVAPLTSTKNYDINKTGNPTWSGNYIIAGSHRTWAKIKNTHSSATSIMKFTGLVSLINLNINLGTGSVNGVIMAGAAPRVRRCQFIGENLTGSAVALELNDSSIKHGMIEGNQFIGHETHMTCIKLDNVSRCMFCSLIMHEFATGIQIVNEASDGNMFNHINIGDGGIGFDIDAGNKQHFNDVTFHDLTTNIDDEVGDHIYENIKGEFPIMLLPDNFTGVDLNTHANVNTWGTTTEILSAVSMDKPFRVIGISVEANATEKFRIRLSNDGGTTHFIDKQIEGELNVNKRDVYNAPSGTEFIFNKGTQITGSSKSESGGNIVTVWLEIQKI